MVIFKLQPSQYGTFTLLLWGFLAALLCPTAGAAAPPSAAPTSTAGPAAPPGDNLTDRFYSSTTAAVLNLSKRIDNFFVDPAAEEEINHSRLRIRQGIEVSEGGQTTYPQSINLNLDLPKARKQASLFFQQDTDQGDQDQPSLFPKDSGRDVSFSLNSGLRFVLAQSPRYHLQYQLGSRLLPHWNPFTELRGRLFVPLGDWLFQPTQFLFWRDDEGLGETTRLDFDYQLGKTVRLRLRGEGTFSETTQGYEYRLASSYSQELKFRRGFLVSLEMAAKTRPDKDIVHYLLNFTWRQRIYRDWLYVETGSNVYFRPENQLEPEPSVFLLLEANVGHWGH